MLPAWGIIGVIIAAIAILVCCYYGIYCYFTLFRNSLKHKKQVDCNQNTGVDEEKRPLSDLCTEGLYPSAKGDVETASNESSTKGNEESNYERKAPEYTAYDYKTIANVKDANVQVSKHPSSGPLPNMEVLDNHGYTKSDTLKIKNFDEPDFAREDLQKSPTVIERIYYVDREILPPSKDLSQHQTIAFPHAQYTENTPYIVKGPTQNIPSEKFRMYGQESITQLPESHIQLLQSRETLPAKESDGWINVPYLESTPQHIVVKSTEGEIIGNEGKDLNVDLGSLEATREILKLPEHPIHYTIETRIIHPDGTTVVDTTQTDAKAFSKEIDALQGLAVKKRDTIVGLESATHELVRAAGDIPNIDDSDEDL